MARRRHQPRLLSRADLAEYLSYSAPSAALDHYLHDVLGVRPVPGRRGVYDLRAVDAALDQQSGLGAGGGDLYEQFRKSRAAA